MMQLNNVELGIVLNFKRIILSDKKLNDPSYNDLHFRFSLTSTPQQLKLSGNK